MLVVVATNSDYTHSSIVQFYGPLPIVLTELDILDEVGCLYMCNYNIGAYGVHNSTRAISDCVYTDP